MRSGGDATMKYAPGHQNPQAWVRVRTTTSTKRRSLAHSIPRSLSRYCPCGRNPRPRLPAPSLMSSPGDRPICRLSRHLLWNCHDPWKHNMVLLSLQHLRSNPGIRLPPRFTGDAADVYLTPVYSFSIIEIVRTIPRRRPSTVVESKHTLSVNDIWI